MCYLLHTECNVQLELLNKVIILFTEKGLPYNSATVHGSIFLSAIDMESWN